MSEQLNLKKQLIDQGSHAGAAILILTPLISCPSMLTAAIAGFGCGLVREVTSRGTPTKLSNFTDIVKSPWSLLDISFWTAGAVLAWKFFG
jgi:hypothetical protein